jgi:hypothetical protein
LITHNREYPSVMGSFMTPQILFNYFFIKGVTCDPNVSVLQNVIRRGVPK